MPTQSPSVLLMPSFSKGYYYTLLRLHCLTPLIIMGFDRGEVYRIHFTILLLLLLLRSTSFLPPLSFQTFAPHQSTQESCLEWNIYIPSWGPLWILVTPTLILDVMLWNWMRVLEIVMKSLKRYSITMINCICY